MQQSEDMQSTQFFTTSTIPVSEEVAAVGHWLVGLAGSGTSPRLSQHKIVG